MGRSSVRPRLSRSPAADRRVRRPAGRLERRLEHSAGAAQGGSPCRRPCACSPRRALDQRMNGHGAP